MKKFINILLTLVAIGIVGLIALTVFGITIMGTKADSEYFEKDKKNYKVSSHERILYSYGLDTLNWENYVLKRKINLTLKRVERDSTINFRFIDQKDSLQNHISVQFIKHDKSLYIIGDKHHIIESEKYSNKNLSELPFDLYELIEPYADANGPFLFNSDYGVLNLDVWSAGKQLFYLPKESKVDIEKELLRK